MQGAQPLRISEIVSFGELLGIRKGKNLISFCRRVMACDNAYLHHIRGE